MISILHDQSNRWSSIDISIYKPYIYISKYAVMHSTAPRTIVLPLRGVASASRFRLPLRSRCFAARFPAKHRLHEDGLKLLGMVIPPLIGTP